MAITKVGIMANPPTNIDDYTHILAHLDAYAKQVGNQGMLLTQWGNASGVPKIAKGSYISHGGTLFVVDTEDFAIPEPADGTFYLRVAVSGASLAVSWVSGLAGYAWNAIYNGLYDGSENQILPYMLVKSGGTLEKWKITNLMQGGGFNRVDYLGRVGALTCASVTIADIRGEVYPSTSMKTSFASPSAAPYGLAFNGTDLISCDSSADMIYVHNGVSATIKTSFASPSAFPSGLTFNGTDLISCDYNSKMIYIHNGISASIKTSFASPSAAPYGLAFNGTDLISCGLSEKMIYIHKNKLEFIEM